jgi:hypothetical protein
LFQLLRCVEAHYDDTRHLLPVLVGFEKKT